MNCPSTSIPLELLLREALEAADHASCLMDARGGILYCNAAFSRLTGYTREELLAGGYALLRSPEAPPELYRHLWHTVRQGTPWRGCLPYRHENGDSRPSSITVTPFGRSPKTTAAPAVPAAPAAPAAPAVPAAPATVPAADMGAIAAPAAPAATPPDAPESPPRDASDTFFYVTQLDIRDQLARDEERKRIRERLEHEVWLQSEELAKLYSISAAVHTSLDLEETLRIVLVAVTAGEGYRFNRAFLFLREHGQRDHLVGQMAMGPFDAEQAARIWRAMAGTDHQGKRLADIVRQYGARTDGIERDAEAELSALVRGARIPLDRPRCPLTVAVRERRALCVGPESAAEDWTFCDLPALQTSTFAVVPLIHHGEAEGCILVDNAITQNPIAWDEVRILELFADHAAHAIANAMLYERVHDLLDERNEALDQLRANQRRQLEFEKLAALGRMAAVVVHELRTPLAVIGGYARHLLKNAPEDGSFREDLMIVRDEVERLEDVVERLLFYSRPKDPSLKPNRFEVCIANLVEYLRAELDRKKVGVEVALPPDLPEFPFDRRQIRQVFLNLLINAVQAMPQGGTIRLRAEIESRDEAAAEQARFAPIALAPTNGDENTSANDSTPITATGTGQTENDPPAAERESRTEIESDGKVLRVELEDSGSGLPAEILPYLFQPFHTTKPKGTGLGLYVAQRIVESHGGRIHAENLPGAGARFTVRLPLAPGKRAEVP